MAHRRITLKIMGEVDLWVLWLLASGLSAGTVRNRRHYILAYLRTVPDPWTATLDEMTVFLSRVDWAPETRKSARTSLRSFYGWAFITGRSPADVTGHLPRVRVPQGIPRPTPEVAVAEAMLRADREELLMITLAAYAGLRLHEIAKVHSDDLTEQGLRVMGKGGRVRLVPLHEFLIVQLAGLAGWAFPSPARPGQHVGVDYVGRRVSRLLGDGWTTHTLRHRFATRAYAASHDQFAVQRLLGHSKPETTARYVAVAHADLAAAVNGVV